MTRYAEKTQVSSDRSKVEIERTLSRYGASSFMYGWQETAAMVAFEMSGRRIKFVLPMPDKSSPEIMRSHGGRRVRTLRQREAAYEQAVRQKWRHCASLSRPSWKPWRAK